MLGSLQSSLLCVTFFCTSRNLLRGTVLILEQLASAFSHQLEATICSQQSAYFIHVLHHPRRSGQPFMTSHHH
eukprot:c42160_g1_i1 orf=147-365(+)